MSTDRGMKKWAPFSSLIEQSTYLEKMHYQKNKKDKPQISSERASKINEIFQNYHGELLEIHYFYDGYIYSIKKTIQRIDSLNKRLIFDNGTLPFSAIIDIEQIDF